MIENDVRSSRNVFVIRDGWPLGYGELLARGFGEEDSVVSIITDGWSERLALQVKAGRTLRSLCKALTRFGVRVDHEFAQRRVDISTDRNHRPFPISPDLIVVVESAVRTRFDFSNFQVPTAFVVIDPYIGFEEHIRDVGVQEYDYVFVSQRDCVDKYRDAGCSNVQWLPPACDPELHGRVEVKPEHDICFVGTIHPKWGAERKRLLDLLNRNFENCWFGRSFGRNLARLYSGSKIAFNKSIFGELNMRIFEALASGTMLITDRIENGLFDLFSEKADLVCYASDDELISEVRHYLQSPDERDRIAEHGCQNVLANHTYRHRAQQIISSMLP